MQENQNMRSYVDRSNLYSYFIAIVAMAAVFLCPKVSFAKGIDSAGLVSLTNQERQDSGLALLNENPLLVQAANAKAQAILTSHNFGHTIGDRTFSSWIKETGYMYAYIGENLAMDFDSNEDIIQAWIASPAHKENLLNPRFREIGIAAVTGVFNGQETIVVAQEFGAPAQDEAEASAPLPRLTSRFDIFSEHCLNVADKQVFMLSVRLGDAGEKIRTSSFRFISRARHFDPKDFFLAGSGLDFIDNLNRSFFSYMNLSFMALGLISISLLGVEYVFSMETKDNEEAAI